MRELSADFPEGLDYRIAYNTTDYVEDSINEVYLTLLIAGALVVFTIFIFLQGIPDDVDVSQLEDALLDHSGVVTVHDTHVWTLDGAEHVLSTHIVVEQSMSDEKVSCLKDIIRQTMNKHGIGHTTLEFEREGDKCDYSALCG